MSDIVVDYMVRRMAIDEGIVHLSDISKAYIVLRPTHLAANCNRDWYAQVPKELKLSFSL